MCYWAQCKIFLREGDIVNCTVYFPIKSFFQFKHSNSCYSVYNWYHSDTCLNLFLYSYIKFKIHLPWNTPKSIHLQQNCCCWCDNLLFFGLSNNLKVNQFVSNSQKAQNVTTNFEIDFWSRPHIKNKFWTALIELSHTQHIWP